MTGGRPLRFLAMTLGGWTAIRVVMLSPGTEPALVPAIRPPGGTTSLVAAARGAAFVVAPPAASPIEAKRQSYADVPGFARTVRLWAAPQDHVAAERPGSSRFATAPGPLQTPIINLATPATPPPLRPTPIATGPSRLAGSAWGILRGGGGSASTGGRLGASQAGMRLTYALGSARRVAVAARVSTPLAGRGTEGAIGLDWQPTRLPLHLVAEQRIAIDRDASSGPALSLIGGLDPLPVAAGFRLEGYGQAGVVTSAGGFVDAAARLARPVARAGGLRLDLGVGAWGGAQRGAARLDVGPGAALVVPLGDRSVRLTLDWRQRVAGRAQPGSGPALSIGSDF